MIFVPQRKRVSTACYRDCFGVSYVLVDDVRTSHETGTWAFTACYRDSFTLLLILLYPWGRSLFKNYLIRYSLRITNVFILPAVWYCKKIQVFPFHLRTRTQFPKRRILQFLEYNGAPKITTEKSERLWILPEPSTVSRMVSSGLLRRVALVRTDVSQELSVSFIRVTGIGELGTARFN
jgi:hypothetical protein